MNKMRKELSIFECGEIVGAWKGNNMNERAIGEVLNYPQNTVYDVISAYKDFEYETLPLRSGKLQLMTKRDQCHLLRIVKKNRRINLQELRKEFITFTSKNICTKNIYNFLHEQGFYDQVRAKKPFISETNKKKKTYMKKRKKRK